MKTLVWPDVHHRHALLRQFLAKNGGDFSRRIFLGDWFDQWQDRPDHAKATAQLIVELMQDPSNIFIEGNHDSSYRYRNDTMWCPGFEWDKSRFINTVMDFPHWEKFKLFHVEQGVICSHAGVHPAVFTHPILGLTIEGITKDCEKAVECARSNIKHPVYAMGMACGGKAPFGGITWVRWGEIVPIEGMNQIVGHTLVNEPEIIYGRKKVSAYNGVVTEKMESVTTTLTNYLRMPPKKENLCSINWNIDTNNRYFAVIENGEISIHKTEDYL